MAEVFFLGNRVAVHPRVKSVQRDPIVNQEHMPVEHRKYLNYNAEDLQTWANDIGNSAVAGVNHFLISVKEPEVSFKVCAKQTSMVIITLKKACTDALKQTASPSTRTISTILKNGMDNSLTTNRFCVPGQVLDLWFLRAPPCRRRTPKGAISPYVPGAGRS